MTVLREASEDPLYNQPEFLGQVVWPSPTHDGPISSEYQSIEMYPCLTGSNETMEHVFLFQPWWTLGYSLPASVPLQATINVTIHGSDIRYFGPNPAQEVHWNVTILPAVDPAHSVARPDGGITVRNGKGAVLNVTGRLVANHDFDVRLEPRAETLDPYCVHPWQTSQWEPGPLVHVPRTAAEPEGTAFSAQAFRPPPKPPLRTEDGCTARGTMKAALVAYLPNTTYPPFWEQQVEVPVNYETQAQADPSPMERVDAANDIPSLAVGALLLALVAMASARRRA